MKTCSHEAPAAFSPKSWFWTVSRNENKELHTEINLNYTITRFLCGDRIWTHRQCKCTPLKFLTLHVFYREESFNKITLSVSFSVYHCRRVTFADLWCWSNVDAVLGAEVVDWIVVGFRSSLWDNYTVYCLSWGDRLICWDAEAWTWSFMDELIKRTTSTSEEEIADTTKT